MRISVSIFLGFLIILIMFSITTYINFGLAEQVNENSEYFERSTAIVRNSNRLQRNLLNMVSAVRGYLFTGEEFFLQAYDSALQENSGLLNELQTSLSVEQSSQIAALQQITKLNSEWTNGYVAPLMEAKRASLLSDSADVAFQKRYLKELHGRNESQFTNTLNARIRTFVNFEYNLRESRKTELDRSILRTRKISIFLNSFSIVTGLAIAIFLAQRISKRILKMVSMANEIANGQYKVHMDDKGKDELSHLAASLNHMAKVLSENISLLERKNKELDQFAHIVSHDMKAPLRGIDNVVTWIEEDHINELSPKVKEYLDLIKSRVTRGENLIHGVLSYSRVGQFELEAESVDLNILLNEMKETLPMRPGLQIKVQKNMPVLFTHRVPLLQVFTNLINNAIKHHDKPRGTIKVYFEEFESHYIFHVEDDGPGIAANYHGKIFQIFQTLNNSDSFESTGVGLAIVKKILDDRKQTITVSSTLGKGATFSFTWPKDVPQ